MGPALSCSAGSVGQVPVRGASGTLLLTREGKRSAGGGGEGGGEYNRITGPRRWGGSRPAGSEGVGQEGRHGGYAVARTAPATGAVALAPRVCWKSASSWRAISITWVMTWVQSVRTGLQPGRAARETGGSRSRPRPGPWAEYDDVGSRASFLKLSASAGCQGKGQGVCRVGAGAGAPGA